MISPPIGHSFSHTDDRLIRGLSDFGVDFHEDVWRFYRTSNATEADLPVTFNWPVLLRRFDDFSSKNGQFRDLIKHIVALWLIGVPHRIRPVQAATARARFNAMIRFLLAMETLGHQSLATITTKEVRTWYAKQYTDVPMERRPNKKEAMKAARLVRELHLVSDWLPSALAHDPFQPRVLKQLARKFHNGKGWEAPPEPVCIYLLREAILLIERASEGMISVVESYSAAIDLATKCNLPKNKVSAAGKAAIIALSLPSTFDDFLQTHGSHRSDTKFLATLFRRIQDACFIVITYTTGPRVSEVRRAGPGCLLTRTHLNGEKFDYYAAPRSKKRIRGQSAEQTADMPWVLSPAGRHAIEVLEKLSLPHRRRAGINSYWIGFSGSGLWPRRNPKRGFSVLGGPTLNARLNSFASFIKLSENTGWTGTLHSHMGRKCLARFIAKRDRRALADVAVQFAHLSPYSVDIGYARPDSEFRRLILEELATEFEAGASALACLDENEVYHTMPPGEFQNWRDSVIKFAGQIRSSNEVKRMLGRGVVILPGLWGGCAYRQQTSACRGSATGPNPELRAPLTCKGCVNFRALPEHAPWWREYRDDAVRYLALSGIPEQTRLMIQQRCDHANEVLNVLEDSGSRP